VLGQVTYASPSFREVLGRSPDELLGAPVTCAMHPDDRDRAEQAFRGARGDGRPRTVELRFEPARGETCAFEVAVSSVRDTPREGGALVLVARDVAERRRMQEALRASEERYALAVQGANDGIWDWDLRRNEVHYSARWKAMLGYGEEEIGTGLDEWLDRVEPAHAEGLKRTLALHVEGGTPHFEHEHPLRRKDGSWLWTLSRGVAVRDAAGTAYRMAGSQTDISKRKTAEDELRRAASRDPLTGLANRSLFQSRLEHAVRRASRGDFRFAVLFLDLDQFKVINDSLGHLLGDHLLSGAARRLERCVRPGDTVARMGGDEFTLLLEDVRDEREAVRVAERVLQELRHCFELDGHEVFTSASIGIALGGLGTDVPEHLMRDADTALYRAKSLGRGRYQVFDRHMHDSAVARLQLETELRRALERGEFRLHYQPIVSLGTGAIVGFEALTRWQHPRRGLLPADEFIGVTEENGLILALGRSVMRQACDQAQAWHLRFPQHGLVMSVNLSGRQFSQPDLAAQVEGALQASGLDPQRLALEITESVVMDHAGAAGSLLSDLKRLRVGLNVDDFGTGYSSLSYLQRFPIDALKIDGSFVSRLGSDEDSLEIVRTITTLAHNLGLQVTAEGVETADQLRELRALGCESGQGFHFARALEAEQATALLERQPHW
jgi:diguanylate cyclase (GGDEF)-like protein/PAS domain S-box-containing protein